ncbi:hypothetical protein C0J52_17411 [Blattella germanica]|nr:hypothetical protein C0J52_17411 [Blattella germanica]
MTLVMDRHFNPPPPSFTAPASNPGNLGHLFSRIGLAQQPCLPGPSLTAFQYALLLQHRYHYNNGLLQHKATAPQGPAACFSGLFRPAEDLSDAARARRDERGFRRVDRDRETGLASPEDRQDSGSIPDRVWECTEEEKYRPGRQSLIPEASTYILSRYHDNNNLI